MTTVEILDSLEVHYGAQSATWPTEPYEFLVWWHCGYPASDGVCARGWEALQRTVGVTPEKILAATDAKLAAALKAGGMVPELRAQRLREAWDKGVASGRAAPMTRDEFLQEARKRLKKAAAEAA